MEDVLAHRPGGRIAWRAGKVTSSTRRRRLRPSTVNLLCLTQIWHPLSPSLERLGLDVFKLRNFTSPSFPFSGRVKTRFFSSTALVWLAFNAFLALRVYPEAEVIHNLIYGLSEGSLIYVSNQLRRSSAPFDFASLEAFAVSSAVLPLPAAAAVVGIAPERLTELHQF